jgi:hypothetical protein
MRTFPYKCYKNCNREVEKSEFWNFIKFTVGTVVPVHMQEIFDSDENKRRGPPTNSAGDTKIQKHQKLYN